MNKNISLLSLISFLVFASNVSIQAKVAVQGIQNEAKQFFNNYLKAKPATKTIMLQQLRDMVSAANAAQAAGREDAFAQVSIYTDYFQGQAALFDQNAQTLRAKSAADLERRNAILKTDQEKKYRALQVQAEKDLQKILAKTAPQSAACTQILTELQATPAAQPLVVVGTSIQQTSQAFSVPVEQITLSTAGAQTEPTNQPATRQTR